MLNTVNQVKNFTTHEGIGKQRAEERTLKQARAMFAAGYKGE